MKDFTELSVEELNKMNKDVLVTIVVSLQKQLSAINSQLSFLSDQIALMNQRSFGRKTERLDQIAGQTNLFEIFNEPEFFADSSPEPDVSEVTISGYTRKSKTKRETKLEGLPARIFEHTISDDKLAELFPDGYKELPPEVYKRLSVIPQTFLVDEHHVHVYASKNNNGKIVKADRPEDLFRNSIATPSLVAAIINGKYANHLPLERQAKCYQENGVSLETNTMANWMINSADLYFNTIYEALHKDLLKCKLIHADETPLQVIRDERPAGSESRMWVYRNGDKKEHPIVLYDFQTTRKAGHLDQFLKDFKGVLVSDGYSAYHCFEKKHEEITVAGCWIHAKRKFSDIVKSKKELDTIAAEGLTRISELFHLDGQLKDLDSKERQKQRIITVKPKVDEFFTWVNTVIWDLPDDSATHKALKYCLNQESFLRVFLTDGDIPMDNNPAEQAIRPFTLGRKNWVNIDTIRGAESSAILYSIVETAKANNIKIYDYLELLLTELPKHNNDTSKDFILYLLPWSDYVQEKCGKAKNSD